MQELESRFEQMLASDLAMAQSNMMVRNDQDGYEVFGRWQLIPRADQIAVLARGQMCAMFTDIKNAVSWCIAEKYHQHALAQEILNLERDLQRLTPSLATERWMCKNTQDPAKRIIMEAKTLETQRRWTTVSSRMQRCVWRAKYLQTRGFNDEIARTRRPAPHRTGRDGDRKSNRSAS